MILRQNHDILFSHPLHNYYFYPFEYLLKSFLSFQHENEGKYYDENDVSRLYGHPRGDGVGNVRVAGRWAFTRKVGRHAWLEK